MVKLILQKENRSKKNKKKPNNIMNKQKTRKNNKKTPTRFRNNRISVLV
jgi:hypothetical protein